MLVVLCLGHSLCHAGTVTVRIPIAPAGVADGPKTSDKVGFAMIGIATLAVKVFGEVHSLMPIARELTGEKA